MLEPFYLYLLYNCVNFAEMICGERKKVMWCSFNHLNFISLFLSIFIFVFNVFPFFASFSIPFTDLASSADCYYNYNHYSEGDRILTNEPCLNCTCHNKMLMCYLKVCPFTKPIGQDCTIEKREDQCCPIITCPEGKYTQTQTHTNELKRNNSIMKRLKWCRTKPKQKLGVRTPCTHKHITNIFNCVARWTSWLNKSFSVSIFFFFLSCVFSPFAPHFSMWMLLVPVELDHSSAQSTDLAMHQNHGCSIDDQFYPEGAQVRNYIF